jgi:hypothetical protein
VVVRTLLGFTLLHSLSCLLQPRLFHHFVSVGKITCQSLRICGNPSLTPDSKLDEVTTLLICFRKRFSSNLDWGTDYPDGGLSWFSSVLTAKSEKHFPLSLLRPTACAHAQFSGCSSTTNAHSETGHVAVCCQKLRLGALSSHSALFVLVGALFKKFGLFLNTPRTSNWAVTSSLHITCNMFISFHAIISQFGVSC